MTDYRREVDKMEKKLVPVTLLTGYLGAGKTTLLNQVLSNQKGYKVAVIVNDIGEVNIDASLIAKGGQVTQKDENLVPLQNGCICCTLKVDLINQIIDLIRTGRFDYILIEASGICEPIPIAQSITMLDGSYDKKAKIARLDNIVSVVDVARMADEFGCGDNLVREDIDDEDIENLLIQQIEFCNTIILNKVDTVTPEQLGKVKAIIRKLQPEAEMIETTYGQVDVDEILNTNRFDFEKSSMSAGWIQELEGAVEEDDHDEHEHHDDEHDEEHHHDDEHHHHHDDEHEEHEHHHHDDEHHDKDDHKHHGHHHHHHHGEGETEEYGIGSFVYYRRKPFAKEKFEDWLDEMPKTIIRSKGIIWAAENNNDAYMFEQAGRQINIANAGQWVATAPRKIRQKMMKEDPTLVADWDEDVGDRMIKVVFIGHDMDKAAIIKSLDECLAY
jgi:G3E family GTPase